jgi:hypothetical protein
MYFNLYPAIKKENEGVALHIIPEINFAIPERREHLSNQVGGKKGLRKNI